MTSEVMTFQGGKPLPASVEVTFVRVDGVATHATWRARRCLAKR
jgi:hypothetical protein